MEPVKILRDGFIILKPGYEVELPLNSKNHWQVAREWVIENGFEKLYEETISNPDSDIEDYDDFIVKTIGAIKLHTIQGIPKCYIPENTNNQDIKKKLQEFYSRIGFVVYGKGA